MKGEGALNTNGGAKEFHKIGWSKAAPEEEEEEHQVEKEANRSKL